MTGPQMVFLAAAITAVLLPGTVVAGPPGGEPASRPVTLGAPSSGVPTPAIGTPKRVALPQVGAPLDAGSPAAPPPVAAADVDCRVAKCIALTFDDGPVRQTAQVLDVLRSRGAHATFFVQGIQATPRLALLRRMAAEGNAVGNHSWNHPMFSHLSDAAIRAQLNRTDAVITRAVGPHRKLVRTPYGQADGRIRKAVATFGAPLILWSVDPEDWKYRNTKVVEHKVLGAARRNSIVLMHDIRPTTRAAVATVVDRLQARGYVLVTVPELLGSRLHAGGRYTRG